MPPQTFDVVALRAVDNMSDAITAALPRVAPHGTLAIFSGETATGLPQDFHWTTHPIPSSPGRVHIGRKPA